MRQGLFKTAQYWYQFIDCGFVPQLTVHVMAGANAVQITLEWLY